MTFSDLVFKFMDEFFLQEVHGPFESSRTVKKKDGNFVNHANTLMNPKRDVSIVDVIYHIR